MKKLCKTWSIIKVGKSNRRRNQLIIQSLLTLKTGHWRGHWMLSDYQVTQCPWLCSQVEAVLCLESIDGIWVLSSICTEPRRTISPFPGRSTRGSYSSKMLHEVGHSEDSQSHFQFPYLNRLHETQHYTSGAYRRIEYSWHLRFLLVVFLVTYSQRQSTDAPHYTSQHSRVRICTWPTMRANL